MKKITLLIMSVLLAFGLTACGGGVEFDPSSTLNVYTRDTESGTREAFFKGIDFDEAAEDDSLIVSSKTVVTGNSDMIAKIKADEYGLGYISLSSLSGSGLLGLNFEGVEASEENVLNDTYGLKRPFNYMTRVDGDYSSTEVQEIVEALVAYMKTVEGKASIIEKGGIVESSPSDQSWDEIKGNYSICEADNSGIKVYIGGSTSVEKIAKEITATFKGKCGNFEPMHNHEGSSAAYKGTQKTETKDVAASYLDLGFASRGFKDTEIAAVNTSGKICWDAVVAVINNNNNAITNVTAAVLKEAYDGTTSIWDELN